MSTAAINLPRMRAAITLVGRLFTKDELPPTLQKHRQGFRGLSEGFQTYGKEWIVAMNAKGTPAAPKKPTTTPAKGKTRGAGAGTE